MRVFHEEAGAVTETIKRILECDGCGAQHVRTGYDSAPAEWAHISAPIGRADTDLCGECWASLKGHRLVKDKPAPK